MGDWEQKNLVNELARGKEVARQLQMHLNNGTSASQETREYLVQKILVSYEKALSMLTWTTSSPAGDHLQPQPSPGVSGLMSESPPSLNGSPRSDQDSDRDQEHRDHASRKRYLIIYIYHMILYMFLNSIFLSKMQYMIICMLIACM